MKQFFKSTVDVALAMVLSINFTLFQPIAVNAEEVQEAEIIEEVDATSAEEVSESVETDGEETATEEVVLEELSSKEMLSMEERL